MHGLSCRGCGRNRGPYLTAYEIAVKHGYEGSEEEWINSVQSVYAARVTSNNEVYWTCSDTFEELAARAAIQEVHLITMEGRTAFMHGVDENKMVFQTLPYEDDLMGNVYEMYEWTAGGEQRVYWLDAYAPGQAAITKQMLANAVQEELDGAVQKSVQAAKASYQTQEVGADENGKLWVYQPTDFIPATSQPVKTGTMTCQVGIDGEGGLWSEGYKKPETGIPVTDMSPFAQSQLQCAQIIYIRLVDNAAGIEVDYEHSDLHGFPSPQAAIESGADVRIVHTDTRLAGSPRITHPFFGTLGDALAFGGSEIYLDDGYAFGFGWYVITKVGGEFSVTKFYDTNMSLFVSEEPEIEP